MSAIRTDLATVRHNRIKNVERSILLKAYKRIISKSTLHKNNNTDFEFRTEFYMSNEENRDSK